MYKHSKFNMIVDTLEDEKVLMYNSVTNALAVFDTETKKMYEAIDKIEPKSIEEETMKRNFNLLLSNGFIIPQDIDEIERMRFEGNVIKYLNKTLYLTIATTLDCNMACPYCFENKKKEYMGDQIQNKIVEFIMKYYQFKNYESFHVTWYGGEPLLNIDAIYYLSEKFIAFCNERKISYTASIITNGVLLTEEIARKLSQECKVLTAQITIDGLPDLHNKRRILIDGRKSFDIITKNIEDVKKYLQISIRVNVDKNNMNNLDDLVNYFINEKRWIDNPSFYLAPVVEYESNCGKTSCIDKEDFILEDVKYMTKLININDNAVKSVFPTRRVIGCTAMQLGNYVIAPNGDMYTCFNVIGNKKDCVGNVKDMQFLDFRLAKWLMMEPSQECYDCELYPLCAGGCPYERMIRNKHSCDKRLLSLKEKLKLVYAKHLTKKENNSVENL